MGTVRIYLFGKFCIEVNENPIYKLDSRKAEELFNYLLLYRDHPHTREHLADILWGEITSEQSKGYLRKTLWQLQSFFDLYGRSDTLLVDGEWLQINPHGGLWVDVDVLENAFEITQGKMGRELKEEQTLKIERATELYRGDLLEGWYTDWCLFERERLQHHYLILLDKLTDYCETHQKYEEGLMHCEKILHFDRARERTHRRLMRLYYLAGDRTAALRQFEKCKNILQEELDVEPALKTQILYAMLQADNLENLLSVNLDEGNHAFRTRGEPLLEVFRRLNVFQKSLNLLQTQLAQDIQTLQKMIMGNKRT